VLWWTLEFGVCYVNVCFRKKVVVVDGDFADQVDALSALAEPARRALYLYVAGQPQPVGRDQAAVEVGLPRHTAKFHLDKLVDEGLLVAEYRRLSGRSGPGAGRPAKLYRRSDRQLAVTVPQREYELVGRVLAAGVEDAARSGTPVVDAVHRAAAAAGRQMCAEAGEVRTLDDVAAVLARQGYEPRVQSGVLTLANCPFHALAADHTALVCGINLHLLAAALGALGHPASARLAPAPGRCCVVVTAEA
jgi:predicted ArsR family transcriptional regulator